MMGTRPMLTLHNPTEPKDPNKTYFSHPYMSSRTAVFNIHPEEFNTRYSEYNRKQVLIQDAFPELNEDEREFMLTGITPDEWNVLFNDRDED